MRTYMQRMMFFLGGLFSLGASTSIGYPGTVPESPVYVPAPTPAARRVKNRHMRPHLQYSADLPRFPVTRQVMRAELRAIALQDEKNRLNNWAGFRGKDKKYGSRAIARANVFPYLNARGIDQLFNLDYRPGIRVWLERSGRPA